MMRTVLVTGAAGGMGAAICEKLKKEGCRVFALDLRPVPDKTVRSFLCDMTDLSSLDQVKEAVLKECTHLDAIVHAAGIYDLDALSEIDDQRFRRIFEINVFGVYRINRFFLPLMGEGGRVTIITSELAPLNPLPFTGIYAVTKGALEKYAYSLRSELALRGIHVSVIRPGAVSTGLLGVSTKALDRFCEHTEYFAPNARHFKEIVNSVESKSVEPSKITDLVFRSLTEKKPRYVYNINRNFLLRLMSALPDHLQIFILKLILK